MRHLFTSRTSPIKHPISLLSSFLLYKTPSSLSSLLHLRSPAPNSLSLLLNRRLLDYQNLSMATAPPPPPPRSTTPPIGAVVGATNEVGISGKLWNLAKRESIFSLFTPFLISLASGNLRIDTFRHYLSQDVHFLKAFAKAYAMAEEYADDDECKVAISELRKNVLEELKLHGSYAQEWGRDLGKETPPNSATVKYIDFLLDTASGKIEGLKGPGKLATPFEKTKIAAYTLGAMTPCMRLYAFLGKEIQALLDPDDKLHPYKRWIDGYSSPEFQAFARKIEELLEKLSACLTGEELEIIEKLYRQAMKLEMEFFLAQPLVQPAVAPLSKLLISSGQQLVLFTDFDLTCTVVDSSAILAEIAIVTAPKSEQDVSENQIARMPSADLKNTWGVLSTQYTEEYEQCVENTLAIKTDGEFRYETVHQALQLLSDFEKKANARVIESGVLKGVNLEDIKKAGERIILHDGCTTFLQKAVQSENLDVHVHVLSYCWCGDLIRSTFSSGGLNALDVIANEFQYNEASISTGEIVKKVESPIDKVKKFDEILENNSEDNKQKLSVYIGDSVGDLLCLLKADIGIVFGSSSSLRRLGNHFGISFIPLFPGLVKKQRECTEGSSFRWKADPGTLYTTSNWAEIQAFILGP